ncbi:hypothetical protein Tco_0769387 [Tanacetum coccineum]|uniref:Uncharacterized protein n=1 Tax=Tanacetum coccineum TaxID=301880 RepID=A0ABQ4ZAI2_9ASTR
MPAINGAITSGQRWRSAVNGGVDQENDLTKWSNGADTPHVTTGHGGTTSDHRRPPDNYRQRGLTTSHRSGPLGRGQGFGVLGLGFELGTFGIEAYDSIRWARA